MNKEIKNGSDQEVIKKESAKKKSLTKKDLEIIINELKDKELRLKAEFDNFRKRKQSEISFSKNKIGRGAELISNDMQIGYDMFGLLGELGRYNGQLIAEYSKAIKAKGLFLPSSSFNKRLRFLICSGFVSNASALLASASTSSGVYGSIPHPSYQDKKTI